MATAFHRKARREAFGPQRTANTRRMSTRDVTDDEPLLQAAENQERAVPFAHDPTGTTSEEASSHTADDAVSQRPWNTVQPGVISSDTSIKSVDFDELITASKQYDDSQDAAKEWLRSFGALHPGTDVSLQLVSFRHDDTNSSGEASNSCLSLLPVLSGWLASWYSKTAVARNQARKQHGSKNHSTILKEEENLKWLFNYICDYISLFYAGFEEDDVVTMAQCTLDICGKTGTFAHMEMSLQVLYSLYEKRGCPEQILEQTMAVLCGIQGSLSKSLPNRTNDLTRLITDGPQVAEVIQVLQNFIKIAYEINDRKTFYVIRGSLIVLQSLFDKRDGDGNYMLKFSELVGSLLETTENRARSLAADDKTTKLDVEILGLCYSLLESEQRVQDTVSQDWINFVKLISISSKHSREGRLLAGKKSTTSLAAFQSRSEETTKQHEDISRQVDIALERTWDKLSEEQKRLVYEYYMAFSELLDEKQSASIIEFVQKSHLCQTENAGWQQSLDRFAQAFLNDTQKSSNSRAAAVGVVAESIFNKPPTSNSTSSDQAPAMNDLAASQALDKLKSQVLVEEDIKVSAKLVNTLVGAAMVGHLESNDAKSIVEALLQSALRDELAAQDSAEHATLAVDGLVQIFQGSLRSSGFLAVCAYECLVRIASPDCHYSGARLPAMKLLFKIRCDSLGFIYVLQRSESEYIAAALCRTAESARTFYENEISGDQRSTASSTSLSKSKQNAPLWIYPDSDSVEQASDPLPSAFVVGPGYEAKDALELPVRFWLEVIMTCLQQKDTDWEIYSYIIVHLGAQLSNVGLFANAPIYVNFLQRVICEQIFNSRLHEPPPHTGLKKSDVAICVFNMLTPLICYAKDKGSRTDCDELVRAFIHGIGGTFEGTSRGCIHSLAICSLELPASVGRSGPLLLDKMAKNIFQAHLSMHILEFLAGLAQLPEVHSQFQSSEIRTVFGICIKYLEIARERKVSDSSAQTTVSNPPTIRSSGTPSKKPPFRAALLADIGVPQYVSALAYHAMIFWFLSLRLETRYNHVNWLVNNLVRKNEKGEHAIEEQSEVFIDMMQRTTFSDLGETLPHPNFATETDGEVSSASWLVGLSIVTVETAGATGLTQITKRQASGTTYAMYQQFTAETPSHHIPLVHETGSDAVGPHRKVAMLPSHVLLQLVSSASPMSLSSQPIVLPKDDLVKRSLAAFDRFPTVDGHKMGVIYRGPGQKTEMEILANTAGSSEFNDFLAGLGTKIQLENAKFNTQGLNSCTDGTSTYAWRDRVTEIVYHVPTMMPNDHDDRYNTSKKRHIGNDHVNIIFNECSEPFDFNTFPSQFNYVNIVVTPSSRNAQPQTEAYQEALKHNSDAINGEDQTQTLVDPPNHSQPAVYQVHVFTKDDLPSISSASDPKIISKEKVPELVRLIGLNASVFCNAWDERDIGSDYRSSWRARLQEIRRLRKRVVERAAATAPDPKAGGPIYAGLGRSQDGQKTAVYPQDRSTLTGERKVVDYDALGPTDGETLTEQMDFSKWTVKAIW